MMKETVVLSQNCGNCQFWRNPEPESKDGRHACRRFPPVVITKRLSVKGMAVYPGTLEHDWCGEWESK